MSETQLAGTGTRRQSNHSGESDVCFVHCCLYECTHPETWLVFLFKHWFKIVGSGRGAVLQQVLL